MTETIEKGLKYYQELDKKLEFVSLTFDKMFKSVFIRNKNILKEFLILELDLDMKKEDTTIAISPNELLNELNKEYKKNC